MMMAMTLIRHGNRLPCVLGMGTMPWTVNSEIYPLWARSTGNACSSGVNWIFNVLVSLTFLHVAQFLTYYGEDGGGGHCHVSQAEEGQQVLVY